MALNVPNIFPATQGAPVIQYVGQDIVQGVGYVQFYAALASSHANTEQGSYGILTTTQIYSDSISKKLPNDNAGNAWLKASSHSFISGNFLQAVILDGQIDVQVPVAVHGGGAIGEGYRVRPEVRFFKVLSDGSSEALTDAQSGAAVYSGDSTWVSKVAAIPIDIRNKTIKPLERLRMDMVVWSKANDAGSELPQPYIAFDPQNRTNSGSSPTGDLGWSGSSSGATQLNIFIPFKIDR